MVYKEWTKEKNMVIMLEIVMALKLYKFTSLCFERKAHAHCTGTKKTP